MVVAQTNLAQIVKADGRLGSKNGKPSAGFGLSEAERYGNISHGIESSILEKREALVFLPFLFFFLALVAQLIKLNVIKDKKMIVESHLFQAWHKNGDNATWQRYVGKAQVFVYKVPSVPCQQDHLPVFFLVTPSYEHNSLLSWLIALFAALLYGFQVLVIYASAAYFDRRFFRIVCEGWGLCNCGLQPARRVGKRKPYEPCFLCQ